MLVSQHNYEIGSYNNGMKDTIGNRIKEIRQEAKLNQSEFGKLLNVSQDTVSLWENGKSLPLVEHVITIANTFNVSSDFILCIKDF